MRPTLNTRMHAHRQAVRDYGIEGHCIQLCSHRCLSEKVEEGLRVTGVSNRKLRQKARAVRW